jgi:hypothetical protein
VGRLDLGAVSGRSWAALAYLAVAGSVVAFSAYVWVLGRLPVSTVATYAYVNPVIAVGVGALVLGEPIGGTVVVGGLVIVGAVALVVTAEGRKRRAAEATEAMGAAGSTPGAVVEGPGEVGVPVAPDAAPGARGAVHVARGAAPVEPAAVPVAPDAVSVPPDAAPVAGATGPVAGR